METKINLSLPGRKKPYVMAHRGNMSVCPENTLAAFQQALTDGADILETDLHLSKDGEFICIHDATLERTTDGRGNVAQKTLAELKQFSAGAHHPMYRQERIPSLAEVAAILPPDVALALELKTPRFLEADVCRRLVAALTQFGVRQRTVVISFHLEHVQAVQAVAPDIPIGWISMTGVFPRRGVQFSGPFFPLLYVNPFYVLQAHRLGEMVCPLDPYPDARLKYYRLLGCDVILSNNPAVTCRFLKR